MQVRIMLKMPPPETVAPEHCKPTPEENVREAILRVDSDRESEIEWNYLLRVYKKLLTMEKSHRVTNLIDIIHPVLAKYGRHEEK